MVLSYCLHKRKAKDVTNYLLGTEDECKDIVVLPPTNVDKETDVDDIDDENVGKAMINSDVAGEFEMVLFGEDDSVEEVFVPKWEQSVSKVCNIKKEFDKSMLDNVVQNCMNLNDLDLFELFFSEDMIKHILHETLRYAAQRNEHNFFCSIDDLKCFLGILMFSGYHQLPQQTHYFNQSEDLGIPVI